MRTRPIILSPIALILLRAGASAGPVTFVDMPAYSEGAVDPQVVVELVPDNPGPYFGGERVIVDVWLHSQATVDVWPKLFRFDFSDTSQELTLDPVFTFDFTSASPPEAYHVFPELPRPWAANSFQCYCSFGLMILPGGGSLHIGSVGALLPTDPDVYTVDTLNADEPDWAFGAKVETKGFYDFPPFTWRAFDGEIAGGVHDFVVIPQPTPLLLLTLGWVAYLLWRWGSR